MTENKRMGHHFIHIEKRNELQMGGVLEVVSFDEDGMMMETEEGLLLIKGTNLHMGKLDLDMGEVSIEGKIDSLSYSDGGIAKESFLGKLFR